MRILHVIPSFVPAWGYGGPIYATFALAQKLAAYGHHVSVVTTNIDQNGTVDVPLERPVEMQGVKVWYFPVQMPRSYCYSSRLWHALREHVRNADVVHLHSIFLWPTSVAAYWARHLKIPYIVRPAGMLDPTCLTKKYDRRFRARLSWLKKTVFLKTIGTTELSRAAGIHFTSYGEMNAAKRWHTNNGFVVPLGVDAID